MNTTKLLEDSLFNAFCEIKRAVNAKDIGEEHDQRQEQALGHFKFVLTCMLAEGYDLTRLGELFIEFEKSCPNHLTRN